MISISCWIIRRAHIATPPILPYLVKLRCYGISLKQGKTRLADLKEEFDIVDTQDQRRLSNQGFVPGAIRRHAIKVAIFGQCCALVAAEANATGAERTKN
jgi:hypothetical protein